MNRRQLLSAILTTAGVAAIAGCSGTGDSGAEDSLPAFDAPAYADWIPEASRDDAGAFFAHLDWTSLEGFDEDEPRADGEDTEALVEDVPILGLPMYGGLIAPFAVFGIMFYPFSGEILPDDEREIDGIATESMTWTEDAIVFRGEYDPELFVARYSEGFEQADERDGFTVYVAPEELAYAVSEDAVVVAIQPGDDDAYRPEDVVDNALERTLSAVERIVDTDDGRWLFETTGDAAMAFGVWDVENVEDVLDPAEKIDTGNEPEAEIELGDNRVLDGARRFVTTLVVSAEDGELLETEARFSGLYPDGSAPPEDVIRDRLLAEDVPHEIVFEGDRVHASATFEELPS